MADTLEIFGQEFTDVTGIKAKNNNDETLKFIRDTDNAVRVIDTEDVHGGIIRSIQGVDITDSTITEERILAGYIGYNKWGNKVTGTAPHDAMWVKIGEAKIQLSAYTDTSTAETIDTGINVINQKYAWLLIIITCDTAITTTTEWGMTATLVGRYSANGNLYNSSAMQSKGSQTLLFKDLINPNGSNNSNGVWIPNNLGTVSFCRKAASNLTIRGGTYTVSVYGLNDIGTAATSIIEDRDDLCEPKDVDFIDYDGRLLHSYTADEFAELTALPPNPYNRGLVAQGWNWTLADAQDFVGKYGALVVGQNYTTDNGRTKIYIHIPQYPLEDRTIQVVFTVDTTNGATIYWGDGTNSIWNGYANSQAVISHTYDTYGDFVIEIEPIEGATIINLGANGANNSIVGDTGRKCCYVKKIEIGNNVSAISQNPFGKCKQLKTLSIPITVTDFKNYDESAFSLALQAIVFPINLTTNRYRAMFPSYSQVKYVSIPKGMKNFHMETYPQQLRKLTMYSMEPYSGTAMTIRLYTSPTITHFVVMGTYTTIGDDRVRGCSVKKIFIPETVTSITGITTFASNPLLEEVHLYPETPPSLANSGAFNGRNANCTFYVPYSSDHSILAAYQAATNWSTFASQMQEEPQS